MDANELREVKSRFWAAFIAWAAPGAITTAAVYGLLPAVWGVPVAAVATIGGGVTSGLGSCINKYGARGVPLLVHAHAEWLSKTSERIHDALKGDLGSTPPTISSPRSQPRLHHLRRPTTKVEAPEARKRRRRRR